MKSRVDYYPKTTITFDGKHISFSSIIRRKIDGVWYEWWMTDEFELRDGITVEELKLDNSMKRWEDRVLLTYVTLDIEYYTPAENQEDTNTSRLESRASDPDDTIWKDPTMLGGMDKDLLKIMKDKWVY